MNRKSWRKLHLGLDLVSDEIVCSGFATDDPTALPDLLGKIGGPVKLFMAPSRGLQGKPLPGNRRRLRWWTDMRRYSRDFESMIKVMIPPLKTAIFSLNAALHPTVHDCHIAEIQAHGCMAWQKTSGYNQRSRG